jgi:hypothetical protein
MHCCKGSKTPKISAVCSSKYSINGGTSFFKTSSVVGGHIKLCPMQIPMLRGVILFSSFFAHISSNTGIIALSNTRLDAGKASTNRFKTSSRHRSSSMLLQAINRWYIVTGNTLSGMFRRYSFNIAPTAKIGTSTMSTSCPESNCCFTCRSNFALAETRKSPCAIGPS